MILLEADVKRDDTPDLAGVALELDELDGGKKGWISVEWKWGVSRGL